MNQTSEVEPVKCCQVGCEADAVFSIVWHERKPYCTTHAITLLNIALFMGFTAPLHTVQGVPGIALDKMVEALQELSKEVQGET